MLGARLGLVSDVYPKDEFDDIPDGGPIGVHRKPSSPWRPVLPFLVVLVVVPLLAWGVASLIQRNVPDEKIEEIIEVVGQSEPQSEEVVEEEVVEEELPDSEIPTAADDGDSADTATDETEEPAEEASGEVNHAASIGVFNASGVSGYAAGVVGDLAAHGFTNAFADNANNWGVGQNTVFYAQDSDKATADAVGAALGYVVVQDATNMGDLNILVLLVG